jgi:hydroxymethylpyrimidine pyrophosphatase-like HAD family hydrolase
LAQDICWAHPDNFLVKSSNKNLAIEPFTKHYANQRARLLQLLEKLKEQKENGTAATVAMGEGDKFSAPPKNPAADKALALAGLAAFYIFVFPIAALLIKATSRGSVFFRQTRPGYDGKPFEIIKLRTCYENEPSKATPVGKILRHFGIDEFPQLWLVMTDEMALIGPRPKPEGDIRMLGGDRYINSVFLGRKPGLFNIFTALFGPNQGIGLAKTGLELLAQGELDRYEAQFPSRIPKSTIILCTLHALVFRRDVLRRARWLRLNLENFPLTYRLLEQREIVKPVTPLRPEKALSGPKGALATVAASAGLGLLLRWAVASLPPIPLPVAVSLIAVSGLISAFVFLACPYIPQGARARILKVFPWMWVLFNDAGPHKVMDDFRRAGDLAPAAKTVAGFLVLSAFLALAFPAAAGPLNDNPQIGAWISAFTAPAMFFFADAIAQGVKIRTGSQKSFDKAQSLLFLCIGIFQGFFCPVFFNYVKVSFGGDMGLALRPLFLMTVWAPFSYSMASAGLFAEDIAIRGKPKGTSLQRRLSYLQGFNGYMFTGWFFWSAIYFVLLGFLPGHAGWATGIMDVADFLFTYIWSRSISRHKAGPSTPRAAPALIGKTYKIVGVTVDRAKRAIFVDAIDRQSGRRKRIRLDVPVVRSRLYKYAKVMMPASGDSGELLSRIIGAIPKRAVFFGYYSAPGDLFGIASFSRSMAALVQPIADEPPAVFHEVCEYLVQGGILSLEMSGGMLAVTVAGKRYRVSVKRALNGLKSEGERWAAWPESRLNEKANAHYLIRILQRSVFGRRDTLLTRYIKFFKASGLASRADLGPRAHLLLKQMIRYASELTDAGEVASRQNVARKMGVAVSTVDSLIIRIGPEHASALGIVSMASDTSHRPERVLDAVTYLREHRPHEEITCPMIVSAYADLGHGDISGINLPQLIDQRCPKKIKSKIRKLMAESRLEREKAAARNRKMTLGAFRALAARLFRKKTKAALETMSAELGPHKMTSLRMLVVACDEFTRANGRDANCIEIAAPSRLTPPQVKSVVSAIGWDTAAAIGLLDPRETAERAANTGLALAHILTGPALPAWLLRKFGQVPVKRVYDKLIELGLESVSFAWFFKWMHHERQKPLLDDLKIAVSGQDIGSRVKARLSAMNPAELTALKEEQLQQMVCSSPHTWRGWATVNGFDFEAERHKYLKVLRNRSEKEAAERERYALFTSPESRSADVISALEKRVKSLEPAAAAAYMNSLLMRALSLDRSSGVARRGAERIKKLLVKAGRKRTPFTDKMRKRLAELEQRSADLRTKADLGFGRLYMLSKSVGADPVFIEEVRQEVLAHYEDRHVGPEKRHEAPRKDLSPRRPADRCDAELIRMERSDRPAAILDAAGYVIAYINVARDMTPERRVAIAQRVQNAIGRIGLDLDDEPRDAELQGSDLDDESPDEYNRRSALRIEENQALAVRAEHLLKSAARVIGPKAAAGPVTPQARVKTAGNGVLAGDLKKAMFLGAPSLALLTAAHFVYASPFTTTLSLLYILLISALPYLTARAIERAFTLKGKRYKLIKEFEAAEPMRKLWFAVADLPRHIAYYIPDTLYVYKEAMKFLHPFYQRVLRFHELYVHAKTGETDEPRAVVKTFCRYWPVKFLPVIAILIFAPLHLHAGDCVFAICVVLYNYFLPAMTSVCLHRLGAKKSTAGYWHADLGRWQRLSPRKVDDTITDFVHKNTLNTKTGSMMSWREWLKGSASDQCAVVPVSGSVEDIIVIKSSYRPAAAFPQSNSRHLLAKALADTNKCLFTVVITVTEEAQVSKKVYVEHIMREVKDEIKLIIPHAMIKFTIRTPQFYLTKLLELRDFYNRRRERMNDVNLERELVVCHVKDGFGRIAKVIRFAKEQHIRWIQATGDYIGRKCGIMALEMIMRHVRSGTAPQMILPLGHNEYKLLLALFGEENARRLYTKKGSPVYEGAAVMRSIRRLARERLPDDAPEYLKTRQKESLEFEAMLDSYAKRHMQKWGLTESESVEKAWSMCYMYHPHLLDIVEFMVDNMRFVWSEDGHHNASCIGNISDDYSEHGLKGREALDYMEALFRNHTAGCLKVLRLMRRIWIMTEGGVSEAGFSAQHIKESVRRLADDEQAANRIFGKEIIPNEMLVGIKKAADAILYTRDVSEINERLGAVLQQTMKPMAEIFNTVFKGEGTVFMDYSREQEKFKEREEQRLREGLNTIILTKRFNIEDEFGRPIPGAEACRMVHFMDRTGRVVIYDTDTLDRPEPAVLKVCMEAQGPEEDRYREDMIGNTSSMRGITGRKLADIHKILRQFEPLIEAAEEERLGHFFDMARFCAKVIWTGKFTDERPFLLPAPVGRMETVKFIMSLRNEKASSLIPVYNENGDVVERMTVDVFAECVLTNLGIRICRNRKHEIVGVRTLDSGGLPPGSATVAMGEGDAGTGAVSAHERERARLREYESVFKDYFEEVFKFHLNLFVFLARRMKAKEGRDAQALADTKTGVVTALEDIEREMLKFEGRLSDPPQRYAWILKGYQDAKAEFEKAKEWIAKDNEMAAAACIVRSLNTVSRIRERLLWEKIRKSKPTVKVWKVPMDDPDTENRGKIAIKHRVYKKPSPEARTLVPDWSTSYFKLRWKAGRFLDEQEDSELKERQKMKDFIAKVERDIATASTNAAALTAENTDHISDELAAALTEEKRLALISLGAVKRLIDIGCPGQIKHLLPITSRYLNLRMKQVDNILYHIKKGRVEPFRDIVTAERQELIDRARKIKDCLDDGHYDGAFGHAEQLLTEAGPYFSDPAEPDFAHLNTCIGSLISQLSALRSGFSVSALNQARFWLGITMTRLEDSQSLNEFMALFRDEYTKRARVLGISDDVKVDVFVDVFQQFAKHKQMIRGSPDEAENDRQILASPRAHALQILCLMAALFPLEIESTRKNSEKIPNPIIDALIAIRTMAEIDDIATILKVDRFKELSNTRIFLEQCLNAAVTSLCRMDLAHNTAFLKAVAADFFFDDHARLDLAKAYSAKRKHLHLHEIPAGRTTPESSAGGVPTPDVEGQAAVASRPAATQQPVQMTLGLKIPYSRAKSLREPPPGAGPGGTSRLDMTRMSHLRAAALADKGDTAQAAELLQQVMASYEEIIADGGSNITTFEYRMAEYARQYAGMAVELLERLRAELAASKAGTSAPADGQPHLQPQPDITDTHAHADTPISAKPVPVRLDELADRLAWLIEYNGADNMEGIIGPIQKFNLAHPERRAYIKALVDTACGIAEGLQARFGPAMDAAARFVMAKQFLLEIQRIMGLSGELRDIDAVIAECRQMRKDLLELVNKNPKAVNSASSAARLSRIYAELTLPVIVEANPGGSEKINEQLAAFARDGVSALNELIALGNEGKLDFCGARYSIDSIGKVPDDVLGINKATLNTIFMLTLVDGSGRLKYVLCKCAYKHLSALEIAAVKIISRLLAPAHVTGYGIGRAVSSGPVTWELLEYIAYKPIAITGDDKKYNDSGFEEFMAPEGLEGRLLGLGAVFAAEKVLGAADCRMKHILMPQDRKDAVLRVDWGNVFYYNLKMAGNLVSVLGKDSDGEETDECRLLDRIRRYGQNGARNIALIRKGFKAAYDIMRSNTGEIERILRSELDDVAEDCESLRKTGRIGIPLDMDGSSQQILSAHMMRNIHWRLGKNPEDIMNKLGLHPVMRIAAVPKPGSAIPGVAEPAGGSAGVSATVAMGEGDKTESAPAASAAPAPAATDEARHEQADGDRAKKIDAQSVFNEIHSAPGDSENPGANPARLTRISTIVVNKVPLLPDAERTRLLDLLLDWEKEGGAPCLTVYCYAAFAIQQMLCEAALNKLQFNISPEQYKRLWSYASLFKADRISAILTLQTIENILKAGRIRVEGDPEKKMCRAESEEQLKSYLLFLEQAGMQEPDLHRAWNGIILNNGNSSIDILFNFMSERRNKPIVMEMLYGAIESEIYEKSAYARRKALEGGYHVSEEFKIDSNPQSPAEAFEAICGDSATAEKFINYASGLRMIYSHLLSKDDRRPPLKYALETGTYFKIGPDLYLAPVTGSFRRHLIFAKDAAGGVKFAFEIMIAGRWDDRVEIGVQERSDICGDIDTEHPGKDYCARVIGYKTLKPGFYRQYGVVRSFTDSSPGVIAYEYDVSDDGKRLSLMTASDLDAIAAERGMTRHALNKSIIEQVAEEVAMTHVLGYIGHSRSPDVPTGLWDHNPSNFRLIETPSGVKIKLVGDFGCFERESAFENPETERHGDIECIIDVNNSSHEVPSLSEILGMPQADVYNLFDLHYSYDCVELFRKAQERALSKIYRALLLDVDGTIAQKGIVSKEILDLIRDRLKEGIHVGLLSGRAGEFLNKEIVNILRPQLTDEELGRLHIYALNAGTGYNAAKAETAQSGNYFNYDFNANARKTVLGLLDTEFSDVLSGARLVRDRSSVIPVYIADAATREALTQRINARLKEKGLQQKIYAQDSGVSVDIMPREVYRARALEDMCKRLGLKARDVAGIGDQGHISGADSVWLDACRGFSVGSISHTSVYPLPAPSKGVKGTLELLRQLRFAAPAGIAPAADAAAKGDLDGFETALGGTSGDSMRADTARMAAEKGAVHNFISHQAKKDIIRITRAYFKGKKRAINKALADIGISRWTFSIIGSLAEPSDTAVFDESDVDIALTVEYRSRDIYKVMDALKKTLDVSDVPLLADMMRFPAAPSSGFGSNSGWHPSFFPYGEHELAIRLMPLLGRPKAEEHHLIINVIDRRGFKDSAGYDRLRKIYYWLEHGVELISSDASAREKLMQSAGAMIDFSNGGYERWEKEYAVEGSKKYGDRAGSDLSRGSGATPSPSAADKSDRGGGTTVGEAKKGDEDLTDKDDITPEQAANFIYIIKNEFSQKPRTKDGKIHLDVIDIGTASGRVPVMLKRLLEKNGFEINMTATDSSSPDERWVGKGVEFLPYSTESLMEHFGKGKFDLVISSGFARDSGMADLIFENKLKRFLRSGGMAILRPWAGDRMTVAPVVVRIEEIYKWQLQTISRDICQFPRNGLRGDDRLVWYEDALYIKERFVESDYMSVFKRKTHPPAPQTARSTATDMAAQADGKAKGTGPGLPPGTSLNTKQRRAGAAPAVAGSASAGKNPTAQMGTQAAPVSETVRPATSSASDPALRSGPATVAMGEGDKDSSENVWDAMVASLPRNAGRAGEEVEPSDTDEDAAEAPTQVDDDEDPLPPDMLHTETGESVGNFEVDPDANEADEEDEPADDSGIKLISDDADMEAILTAATAAYTALKGRGPESVCMALARKGFYFRMYKTLMEGKATLFVFRKFNSDRPFIISVTDTGGARAISYNKARDFIPSNAEKMYDTLEPLLGASIIPVYERPSAYERLEFIYDAITRAREEAESGDKHAIDNGADGHKIDVEAFFNIAVSDNFEDMATDFERFVSAGTGCYAAADNVLKGVTLPTAPAENKQEPDNNTASRENGRKDPLSRTEYAEQRDVARILGNGHRLMTLYLLWPKRGKFIDLINIYSEGNVNVSGIVRAMLGSSVALRTSDGELLERKTDDAFVYSAVYSRLKYPRNWKEIRVPSKKVLYEAVALKLVEWARAQAAKGNWHEIMHALARFPDTRLAGVFVGCFDERACGDKISASCAEKDTPEDFDTKLILSISRLKAIEGLVESHSPTGVTIIWDVLMRRENDRSLPEGDRKMAAYLRKAVEAAILRKMERGLRAGKALYGPAYAVLTRSSDAGTYMMALGLRNKSAYTTIVDILKKHKAHMSSAMAMPKFAFLNGSLRAAVRRLDFILISLGIGKVSPEMLYAIIKNGTAGPITGDSAIPEGYYEEVSPPREDIPKEHSFIVTHKEKHGPHTIITSHPAGSTVRFSFTSTLCLKKERPWVKYLIPEGTMEQRLFVADESGIPKARKRVYYTSAKAPHLIDAQLEERDLAGWLAGSTGKVYYNDPDVVAYFEKKIRGPLRPVWVKSGNRHTHYSRQKNNLVVITRPGTPADTAVTYTYVTTTEAAKDTRVLPYLIAACGTDASGEDVKKELLIVGRAAGRTYYYRFNEKKHDHTKLICSVSDSTGIARIALRSDIVDHKKEVVIAALNKTYFNKSTPPISCENFVMETNQLRGEVHFGAGNKKDYTIQISTSIGAGLPKGTPIMVARHWLEDPPAGVEKQWYLTIEPVDRKLRAKHSRIVMFYDDNRPKLAIANLDNDGYVSAFAKNGKFCNPKIHPFRYEGDIVIKTVEAAGAVLFTSFMPKYHDMRVDTVLRGVPPGTKVKIRAEFMRNMPDGSEDQWILIFETPKNGLFYRKFSSKNRNRLLTAKINAPMVLRRFVEEGVYDDPLKKPFYIGDHMVERVSPSHYVTLSAWREGNGSVVLSKWLRHLPKKWPVTVRQVWNGDRLWLLKFETGHPRYGDIYYRISEDKTLVLYEGEVTEKRLPEMVSKVARMPVGKRVMALRQFWGYTTKELAQLSGTSQRNIIRFEKGNVRKTDQAAMARSLNVLRFEPARYATVAMGEGDKASGAPKRDLSAASLATIGRTYRLIEDQIWESEHGIGAAIDRDLAKTSELKKSMADLYEYDAEKITYTIRLDTTRVPFEYVRLIGKYYTKILASDKVEVKVHGNATMNGLVRVSVDIGGKLQGEGAVDFKDKVFDSLNIGRLVGVVNLAMSVASLPDEFVDPGRAQYKAFLDAIGKQYELLTGYKIELPKTAKDIRALMLMLPRAKAYNAESQQIFKLMEEKLRTAA